MKRFISLLVFACVAGTAFAANSEALKVKTYTLSNGLTVWINEDPNQVAVYGATVVKAGAVDCPGTGIAHYFEHMMFKGTDKIGTVDYAAEKQYLDSIAVKYDELALATDDAVRKDIQMEINRLSIKAADYAIPNEFDNLISEMGGSGLNAFTSYDETVYHNQFLPEYFAQWAELNSERIMNPVFRLFQSELETVYEEKNRSDDNLISDFRNKMLSSIFEGTGYAEEVIGTTDNLKNPRLSQMREFFEKYYVASNMGLVLTGNIKAEEALPILEKTFGRIRRGEKPVREVGTLTELSGRKDVQAMVNMPIVKIGALCFRGPAKTDPDYIGMSFLASMLNNDAQTGLLDKLMVDHKLMMAMAMPDLSFKNAGSFMVLYMPKLLFQKDEKAAKCIMDAFDSIKKGDFSDDFFQSCKLSFKKQMLTETENLGQRMENLVFAMSEDLDWDDVLSRADRIDAMTKDDLVALAQKYLGDDYIHISKKKGLAMKDNLKKPDYEKVVPKHKDSSSAYAAKMRESAAKIKVAPRAVDYENAVDVAQAAPLVKVYAAQNPYNDIFGLTLSFGIGTNVKPELERSVTYASLLGTSEKSFEEIHDELQTIGAGVYFSCDERTLSVNISGFDSNFEQAVVIAADLVKNIKGDRKKLSNCKSDEKSSLIMNRKDMDELATALYKKTVYGDKSPYLADKGKFNDQVVLGALRDAMKYECDVTYSGTLPAETVASVLAANFDFDAVTIPYDETPDFSPVVYDGPQLFFLDKKDASQSQIYSYLLSGTLDTQYDRYFSSLFSEYLGGGMASLLFQEIREFRSMAYSTGGRIRRPSFRCTTTVPSHLMTYVGTQCDKTIDAMDIVDSLVTNTPFHADRISFAKKSMLNDKCNAYPDFRSIADEIVSDKRDGFTYDPVPEFMKVLEDADENTVKAFWEKYISGRHQVWAIVGSSKKVDMAALEKYGTVTMVKPADVIK